VVASIARLLFLAVAGLAMLVLAALRLWYRAVLAAPQVKRRKAARRLAASVAGKAADARAEDRPPTAG
jgi:hypothetical protein